MFSLIYLYFAYRRDAVVAPIVPEAPAAVVARAVMKQRQVRELPLAA